MTNLTGGVCEAAVASSGHRDGCGGVGGCMSNLQGDEQQEGPGQLNLPAASGGLGKLKRNGATKRDSGGGGGGRRVHQKSPPKKSRRSPTFDDWSSSHEEDGAGGTPGL